MVGQNNHGKSNIFYALDLFFSSTARKLSPEVFFRPAENSVNELSIEAVFGSFTEAEKEKLGPWISDDKLTIAKIFSLTAEGKIEAVYEALMRVPEDDWLREDYPEYANRDVVSKLPISKCIPSGRITKEVYKEAISRYIASSDVKYKVERRKNPAGFKQVLDGYLPEFHLVPAIREVGDEIKPTGQSSFARIMAVVVNRILEKGSAYPELHEKVQAVKETLENERIDDVTQLEDKMTEAMKAWGVKLEIKFQGPNLEDILQLGTTISVNDGVPTSVEEKGHGVQRSLIFALMKIEADLSSNEPSSPGASGRSHIFAFEEPELFLHPQMCRSTYLLLKKISDTDQIMLCTHSANFVDLSDYQSLVIVRKNSVSEGTKIIQPQESFETKERDQFKIARFFNPDRNELFFARRVVLVEGPTEKVLLPFVGERLGILDNSVSVVNCEGKANIPLFMRVANAFQIPYVAVYDEDPIPDAIKPGMPEYEEQKYDSVSATFNLNKVIVGLCNTSIGQTVMIKGKLEDALGISEGQVKKYGKPLAAIKRYDEEGYTIPEELEKVCVACFKETPT